MEVQWICLCCLGISPDVTNATLTEQIFGELTPLFSLMYNANDIYHSVPHTQTGPKDYCLILPAQHCMNEIKHITNYKKYIWKSIKR